MKLVIYAIFLLLIASSAYAADSPRFKVGNCVGNIDDIADYEKSLHNDPWIPKSPLPHYHKITEIGKMSYKTLSTIQSSTVNSYIEYEFEFLYKQFSCPLR